jgi:hypothetical protein
VRSEERRLALARERGREAVASLAREACLNTMPLICRPPPPVEPFAYGDLVPLGFLLRAVNVDTYGTSAVRRDLEDLLRGRRQGLLWPYHSGTLVTCIDSALVLQGFRDPAGVEALEIFANGRCGYLPQLCSEEPERDRMTVTPQNRHWCQPDYGTTCLVTALRAEAGLEGKTSIGYLAGGFESRSGLYFANPYMMDWALAWALQGGASTTALRERLATEILASMNEDNSFGRYDVPVSTALAILALVSLGVGGQTVRRARLRLADFMMPDGRWAASTPFYSALTIPRERCPGGLLARLMLGERRGHLAWIEGAVRAVSLYIDEHHAISTALAVLSLTQPDPPVARSAALPMGRGDGGCHPRYRCEDHMEYIAGYALPPYIAG